MIIKYRLLILEIVIDPVPKALQKVGMITLLRGMPCSDWLAGVT